MSDQLHVIFGAGSLRAALTTVYGDQVFPKAIQGKAANIFGDIEALHTFVYVDGFARGLVALAETPSAMGQVWHRSTVALRPRER